MTKEIKLWHIELVMNALSAVLAQQVAPLALSQKAKTSSKLMKMLALVVVLAQLLAQ